MEPSGTYWSKFPSECIFGTLKPPKQQLGVYDEQDTIYRLASCEDAVHKLSVIDSVALPYGYPMNLFAFRESVPRDVLRRALDHTIAGLPFCTGRLQVCRADGVDVAAATTAASAARHPCCHELRSNNAGFPLRWQKCSHTVDDLLAAGPLDERRAAAFAQLVPLADVENLPIAPLITLCVTHCAGAEAGGAAARGGGMIIALTFAHAFMDQHSATQFWKLLAHHVRSVTAQRERGVGDAELRAEPSPERLDTSHVMPSWEPCLLAAGSVSPSGAWERGSRLQHARVIGHIMWDHWGRGLRTMRATFGARELAAMKRAVAPYLPADAAPVSSNSLITAHITLVVMGARGDHWLPFARDTPRIGSVTNTRSKLHADHGPAYFGNSFTWAVTSPLSHAVMRPRRADGAVATRSRDAAWDSDEEYARALAQLALVVSETNRSCKGSVMRADLDFVSAVVREERLRGSGAPASVQLPTSACEPVCEYGAAAFTSWTSFNMLDDIDFGSAKAPIKPFYLDNFAVCIPYVFFCMPASSRAAVTAAAASAEGPDLPAVLVSGNVRAANGVELEKPVWESRLHRFRWKGAPN